MSDLVPPDDLVALKAAWYAADERAHQLSEVEPEGKETIPRNPLPGKSDTPIRLLSEQQSIALNGARAERLELTLRLFRHPWKSSQANVQEAGKALDEAAHALWMRQKQESEAPGAVG